jgi:ATP-dependent Lhr-like helicase
MVDPLTLKAQLPHTWPVFFARHGHFTAVQQQAIPPILAGHDTLVVAATASGKTEAAIAPLLERHVLGQPAPQTLTILYICPTRALVRDLYERLAPALHSLRVTLRHKSGDTAPVSERHPPTVLITTPESTDSLLARAPRLFASLRAIVLDEIHLFDRSVRGDHLRCLLRRSERIRAYHQQQSRHPPENFRPTQRIALSATVADPAGVARRYLLDPVVVQVAGARTLLADSQPLNELANLVAALAQRATRKTLLFCNTRNEVEQVGAYLRRHLPYEATIFVHYSNLDAALRREVETQFAEASVAICVSSSTLELGIDIGSIDDIVLVGPPPTLSSLLQRIGRGGRRTGVTRFLAFYRSPLEQQRLAALLDLARASTIVPSPPSVSPGPTGAAPSSLPEAPYHFKPSVLVQQIFSFLKASPTGALRLDDLRRVAADALDTQALRDILAHLRQLDYLRPGRPGEWRPGPALDPLVDEHEIYSNIGGDLLGATVIDAYSGRRLAQTERPRRKGETLLLGGRPVEVAWQSGRTFGIRPGRQGEADEVLRFHTAPFAVPLQVAQAVGRRLGFAPGQMPLLTAGGSSWLFHFWGDLYSELLAALLQSRFPPGDFDTLVEPWNELCLRLPGPLASLPPWDARAVQQHCTRLAPRLEPFLELGRFQSLLPPPLALATIISHCDLPHFEQCYRAASIVLPPSERREALLALI